MVHEVFEGPLTVNEDADTWDREVRSVEPLNGWHRIRLERLLVTKNRCRIQKKRTEQNRRVSLIIRNDYSG